MSDGYNQLLAGLVLVGIAQCALLALSVQALLRRRRSQLQAIASQGTPRASNNQTLTPSSELLARQDNTAGAATQARNDEQSTWSGEQAGNGTMTTSQGRSSVPTLLLGHPRGSLPTLPLDQSQMPSSQLLKQESRNSSDMALLAVPTGTMRLNLGLSAKGVSFVEDKDELLLTTPRASPLPSPLMKHRSPAGILRQTRSEAQLALGSGRPGNAPAASQLAPRHSLQAPRVLVHEAGDDSSALVVSAAPVELEEAKLRPEPIAQPAILVASITPQEQNHPSAIVDSTSAKQQPASPGMETSGPSSAAFPPRAMFSQVNRSFRLSYV